MILLIFPQFIYIDCTFYKALYNQIKTASKTNQMFYYLVYFITQPVLIQITLMGSSLGN